MSVRDDLKAQGSRATEITKLLGGGMAVFGALTGNKQLEGLGAGTLLTGMLASGDFMPPPIRRLHSWRSHAWDSFNRRVDMWRDRGRWAHHHHHHDHHLATPGFIKNRSGRW